MNTRKQLTNRILSLVLTFVMVVGVLPMTVIPARAAELEHIEIDFSGNTYTESPGAGIDLDVCFYCYECDKTIAPGENDGTHSFTLSDFSYDIKKSGFRATLSYQVSGCLGSVEATDVVFSSDFRYGGYKNSNCTDGAYSFFTKFSGDYRITMKVKLPKMLHDGSATCCTAASCSTCGHSYTDASNHEQPDTFICRANTADSTKHNIVYACCGAVKETEPHTGEVSYTVNATDKTKHDIVYACCGAVKETEPHTGEVSYTVNATDKTKHDIAYSCCQGVAETVAHQTLYTVTAKNTLKETCALGCGHTATATLTAEDSVYTGSAITPASISYSENWLGSKADASAISYGDNVNAGVVDVSADIQANVLFTSFTIQRADIAGATVTLSPAQTQYTGDAQEPDIAVVWNGMTLSQDKDYTVSWDKTGFTESGTYTATIVGIGNFTGAVEKTFTIQPANFGGMTAEQIGTLTYNKTAQIPQVDISAVSVNDQPITITYSTQYEGPFGSMPGVTNAGTHIIYYKLSAPNHNDEIGQVRVYVDYGIPDHTPPVAKDLTYDGTEQALIIGGSVEDGQMLYGFDQIDYFPQIPAKTEAGEYTVHYVIPASMNYDVLRGTVTVQIKKADQDAPTVGKTDETISGKLDGSITGVDETMEYRAESADTYTAITGDTVTGRAAGTYYVRCKGDNNHNPSADTKVTIAPGRKLKLTLPQETPGYTLTATAQELD